MTVANLDNGSPSPQRQLEKRSTTNRVEALTGARALAALYVLALHFGRPLCTDAPSWVRTIRESGYVATSFFLMLSGFVLTVAYGRKLADGRVDRASFVVSRVARLYPAYALALLLVLPFAFVHSWGWVTASFGDASWKSKVASGIAHVEMLHVLIPRFATSWNVPDWCVSVEMWFYLAFPVLVAWLLGKRLRVAVGIAAGAWLVTLALSIGYTVRQPDGFRADESSVGAWLEILKYTPYTRWPEFVFGSALGVAWLRLPVERRGQRWATPLLLASTITIAAILLHSDRIPYTVLHNGALLPLYGVLAWSLMLGRGPFHRVLSARPLTALGDSSYVLYVLQVPLMQWMTLVTGNRFDSLSASFTAVALPIVIGVAVAVHFTIETPMQRWLKPRLHRTTSLVRHRNPTTAATAAT